MIKFLLVAALLHPHPGWQHNPHNPHYVTPVKPPSPATCVWAQTTTIGSTPHCIPLLAGGNGSTNP